MFCVLKKKCPLSLQTRNCETVSERVNSCVFFEFFESRDKMNTFNQPGNSRELADVRQFEQMIGRMFDVKASQEQRQMANKQLMKVCSNLNFSNTAQSIFRFSNNKAALANASSALLQLISNHWNSFPKDQVFRIRMFFFLSRVPEKKKNDVVAQTQVRRFNMF